MRVDKLYLPDYRNLQEFLIDFDETSPRTVLIGRNGVGKTNILEALTSIFRQLDLRIKPDFAYKINYSCNGFCIEVAAIRGSGLANGAPGLLSMVYKVVQQFAAGDNESSLISGAELAEMSETAFYRMNGEVRLLPKHVFGYYSGTSRRLRDLFVEHTENYRDELIRGEEGTIRPLFF